MRDRNANERRPRRPKSATRASADRRTLEKCRRRDRRATDPCCCCYRYRYTETSLRPCAVVCRDERTTSPRTPEASLEVGVPSPRAGWTSRVSLTVSRLGVPAHNLKARAVPENQSIARCYPRDCYSRETIETSSYAVDRVTYWLSTHWVIGEME